MYICDKVLNYHTDAPIQFETMQGQNIETPTDLMEKMEEAAINATGVPMELVNSVLQADYATRYSMSNTRFLKTVFTRQRKTERFFSLIYTKLYNYEFVENYNLIEVILPPPTYLTITNTQQMLDSATQLADKVADLELNGEEDEIKSEFKKLYIRSYLNTYIDYDSVANLVDLAKTNIEAKKTPAVEDGETSDTYGSDDEDEF